MNKIVLGILLLSTLYSCKPTKEDYRKDYVKGCVNRYASDSVLANEKGRKLIEDYCNCEGDMLNEQLSREQWRQMNKGTQEQMDHYLIKAAPCKQQFESERVKNSLHP